MDKNVEEFVKQMLYDKNIVDVIRLIDEIADSEILHLYAYNYNWDNGFEIPKKIIHKDCCQLSTALMMFYAADGIRYLQDKSKVNNLKEWSTFIKELYNKIINNGFIEGAIKFNPPLSKVQIFKIKKVINTKEEAFLKEIGTNDLNVYL
ncbi:DUF4274 domain-containing protein [Herbinix luporum]|jgi:hypothetical protein|uniref:DUF4274 domain-containing protein n=1 Tax=Herbinix luporum TaxID=1679721 RepID=A0A0K8J487_9FIRM|nr:DUF4274 domain-containing protein [Herbinix luporum]CUH92149.1 hypothetical protein SD1D_0598 [Herbinix luporum]